MIERTPDEIAEAVARHFHDTYEQLAPEYGWQTQESTRAKPWEEVPEHNRRLMVATIRALLDLRIIEVEAAAIPPATPSSGGSAVINAGLRPARYTSVPTVVEAMRYTPDSRRDVEAWLTSAGATWWPDSSGRPRLMTPQGSKPVELGEWIVRGVVGEWYPVADKVFRLRYRENGG